MILDEVKKEILSWAEKFLEVPNSKIENWSPCPFARRARLSNSVDIRLGTSPIDDLAALANQGLEKFEVVIYAYDADKFCYQEFSNMLDLANVNFLLDKDIICLEDHPADKEIVNELTMNQGKYAMAMCQSLSDLNSKAKILAEKGFYNSWPEEYLTQLFKYRQDPRK